MQNSKNHILKIIAVLVLNLSMLSFLNGQTLGERIAFKACEYLDSIDNYSQLEDSIRGSITKAMADIMFNGTEEERNLIGTVEGIKGTMGAAFKALPSCCYNVRRLMIKEKEKKFYRMSDNLLANEHYKKGNKLMDSGEYKKSRKEFEKALKEDDKFVYAIDHLAISYRRVDDFKTAIRYYEKSLQIFPEGDVALVNIAVCHSFLGDYENSLKYYESIKFLYPDNPEGYFGSSKAYFLMEQYEDALNNMFIAHRMYTESNSDYVKDSEKLLQMMCSKLKELNKADIFENIAKEHNVTME